MKGLKLEPGWRHAWVTWLNLLREVEAAGQRADRAGARVGGGECALDLGSWVISQRPLSFG